MSTMKMDGILFQKLCKGGLQSIIEEEKKINGLNVFPVPDGDTGTNMKLTLSHGVEDAMENASIGAYAKALARGMLLGARGNSGVILSQLFKGISKYLKAYDAVNAKEFAEALVMAYETAYSSVIHPVEGTILTVSRLGICNILDQITENTSLEELFSLYIASMNEELQRTPELLPVLKEAGVIDSGGAGLIVIFEGMEGVLLGTKVLHSYEKINEEQKEEKVLFDENSVLEYGYCTEFILQLQNSKVDIDTFDLSQFIAYLETKGDSIVALKDESIVKVHVHTKTPGDILNEAQKYGEFVTMKMENMSIQHNEVLEERKKNMPKKNIAIIAVGQGEGFMELFGNFGVDIVLDGGKTMNTSTEEFLSAMKSLNYEDCIILPNNKNIFMAAEQAKALYDSKHVHILPTTSLVEGYFALSMSDTNDENVSIDQQLRNMKEGLKNAHTFGVTLAVKDSSYDGIAIQRGEYISVLDGKIVYSSMDKHDAVLNGIRKLPDIDEKEIMILFKGKNLTDEEADEIIAYLDEDYENADKGIIEGTQDTYGVLIGIS